MCHTDWISGCVYVIYVPSPCLSRMKEWPSNEMNETTVDRNLASGAPQPHTRMRMRRWNWQAHATEGEYRKHVT